MWLIDVYRKENSIALWLKKDKDVKIEKKFHPKIYIEPEAKEILRANKIKYKLKIKKNYLDEIKPVLEIKAPIKNFEKFVKKLEKKTKYRIPMYNADITPEQQYLYSNDLHPFKGVQGDLDIALKEINITVVPNGDARNNPEVKIRSITINGETKKGEERLLLLWLLQKFGDPDVVRMPYAFSLIPYLENKLRSYNMQPPFHRFDAIPINYKGGKSYYSYGQVRYQDHSIRLRGRLLVDTTTMSGICSTESIIELSQLSGGTFQQIASRSFGSVFQQALVRNMYKEYLVPYKQKPIDRPISMFNLLKADRSGHTLDPIVGFHKNVAEIDFSSMYPWIIYNKNISAETILKGGLKVKGTHITINEKQGLTPRTIKPFLDRRMEYKNNPTTINKKKAAGLKWVLVTSYGYLRFREFKLGLPSAHMAIGAYAREILLKAMKLSEEKGFEIVHGIVDSLYISKKGITESEVQELCKEIHEKTGIPISFEGLFKWVTFLPSIQNRNRPVPTKYYGVFENGDVKERGIDSRTHKAPGIVKHLQKNCIEIIKECKTQKEIKEKIPTMCKFFRALIKRINDFSPRELMMSLRVSKIDYKNNIPQKKVIEILRKRGIQTFPGQTISYVYSEKGVTLPELMKKADVKEYKKLLVRALHEILQPYIFREKLNSLLSEYYQTNLQQFFMTKQITYERPRGKPRKGLSERYIRKKLERNGWTVWRGGMLHVTEHEYPNVEKKYKKLDKILKNYSCYKQLRYLSAIHHGMPDFICYKNRELKFVECKLEYETLSRRQITCISELQKLGFTVEVHRLVKECTKDRVVDMNMEFKKKLVLEAQTKLMEYS